MQKLVIIMFLLSFAAVAEGAATPYVPGTPQGSPPPPLWFMCLDSRHNRAFQDMKWVTGVGRISASSFLRRCWRVQCMDGLYFDTRVANNPPCIPCDGEVLSRIRETWSADGESVTLSIESRR